jgi:hypothetical protein
MTSASAEVELLAMAMERLTALEKRADAADAYKAAMPRPHGFYVVLGVPAWSTPEEREERLVQTRRSVLAAVASVAKADEGARWVNVRCFLLQKTSEPSDCIAVVLIGCADHKNAKIDPGELYQAMPCVVGVSVRQWYAIMSRVELAWFMLQLREKVSYAPVSSDDVGRLAGPLDELEGSSADEEVGFCRLRDSPTSGFTPEELEEARQWALVAGPRMHIHRQAADANDRPRRWAFLTPPSEYQ